MNFTLTDFKIHPFEDFRTLDGDVQVLDFQNVAHGVCLLVARLMQPRAPLRVEAKLCLIRG